MYECKILADSISDRGHRLTTFQVTFPRFILAEVNTVRMFSRNSASSRAIPVLKSIQAVRDDPFKPAAFGQNQPGMSFDTLLDEEHSRKSEQVWQEATDAAIHAATKLADLGVHKSLANRILEPFKWHTAVITATDWDNYFALRTDPSAQPEFRTIALQMQEMYREHEPQLIQEGWHLPFVTSEEIDQQADSDLVVDWPMWVQVSTGRCARVSYLTHDGKRDIDKDIELATKRLAPKGHVSPFEHPARPLNDDEWNMIEEIGTFMRYAGFDTDPFGEQLLKQIEYCGNLHGWHSARYDLPNQDDFSKMVTDAVH